MFLIYVNGKYMCCQILTLSVQNFVFCPPCTLFNKVYGTRSRSRNRTQPRERSNSTAAASAKHVFLSAMWIFYGKRKFNEVGDEVTPTTNMIECKRPIRICVERSISQRIFVSYVWFSKLVENPTTREPNGLFQQKRAHELQHGTAEAIDR
jgi:hypothetical protein